MCDAHAHRSVEEKKCGTCPIQIGFARFEHRGVTRFLEQVRIDNGARHAANESEKLQPKAKIE